MRRTRFVLSMIALAGILTGRAPTAAGQQLGLPERSPRFLYSPPAGGKPIEIDASRSVVLRRVVSLKVDRPTIGRLLSAIEQQAGLTFAYSASFPAARPLPLRADSISVGAALSAILFDTGVDVVLSARGHVALVEIRGRSSRELAETGTVVGRVTDAKTGDPLTGAEVTLDGARMRAITSEKGYYRLAEVEAGTYTLTVRRVGYAKGSRAVVVVGAQEVTADVAMQPVVTQLNELVTTVTGEQRARELGHVVGRIDADSVVKDAPITTLSELLNGRVPGLQVYTGSGTVGGTVSLQIRGVNSLTLPTEPIVIVDGFRYTTKRARTESPFNGEETSRINDLNPNDIESIEVVKGPSASTLYGTDAANGVIVVTTKRGRPGQTKWDGYVRSSLGTIPKYHYADGLYGWGTVFGVPNYAYFSCIRWFQVAGYCSQLDSIVPVRNPLNDTDKTIFGPKPSWEYGLSASGGRQELRYYFSGNLLQATGPLRIPTETLELLKQQRGPDAITNAMENPNHQSQLNGRLNVNAAVSTKGEVAAFVGYTRSATRTGSQSAYRGAFEGTPTRPYYSYTPDKVFSDQSTEHLDRFTPGINATLRPSGWLSTNAAVNVDVSNINRTSLSTPGEGTSSQGLAMDVLSRQVSMTANLGAVASFRRNRFTFRTAIGSQYARSLMNTEIIEGSGLAPGSESASQANNKYVYQYYLEDVTLGSYIEETVGLNDRLFLVAAVRADGASNFGSDYNLAAYPKFSASWIASDEPFFPKLPGLDELRFRYAFGASGQQPMSYMTFPSYYANMFYVDGQSRNGLDLSGIGNPLLRPERVAEHEWGLDATGWGGRARLSLTWQNRKTVDQLIFRTLSAGFGSVYTNLGLTRQHGFEAEMTLRPIQSRALFWEVGVTHALSRTKIVDLGGMTPDLYYTGSRGEGYSIGARFGPRLVGYNDANGDGVIIGNEVQVEPLVYLGESTPPIAQTLRSSFGLFDQHLRVSALFERRTGFTQADELKLQQCRRYTCPELIDPNASLAAQAKIIGMLQYQIVPIEDGTFTRLREVSVATDLPQSFARAMRVRSASLALTARNVALWSSYEGPDPESAVVNGFSGNAANGIPQGRSYIVRIDLGL